MKDLIKRWFRKETDVELQEEGLQDDGKMLPAVIPDEEPEDEGCPLWLYSLFCFFGGAAITCVVIFCCLGGSIGNKDVTRADSESQQLIERLYRNDSVNWDMAYLKIMEIRELYANKTTRSTKLHNYLAAKEIRDKQPLISNAIGQLESDAFAAFGWKQAKDLAGAALSTLDSGAKLSVKYDIMGYDDTSAPHWLTDSPYYELFDDLTVERCMRHDDLIWAPLKAELKDTHTPLAFKIKGTDENPILFLTFVPNKVLKAE